MPLATDQLIQSISGSSGIRQVTPNFRSKRDRKEVKSLLEKNRRDRGEKPHDPKSSGEELDTYV